MTPERRQKILVALLPALLIAIAYVYLYELPLGKKLKALDGQIGETEKTAPDPNRIGERQEKLRSLEMQVARTKKIQEMSGAPTTGAGATLTVAEAGQKVARLLASHGLLLLQDSTGEPSALARLPAGLSELAKDAPGRLRTVKLRGKYSDVVAALVGIHDAIGNAIALELRMSPPVKDDDFPEWTLILWI